MGLYESRGHLSKALKDLNQKFQHAKVSWNDAQSEQMEKETLANLERDAKAAAEAIDQMIVLVSAAKRDCRPESY